MTPDQRKVKVEKVMKQPLKVLGPVLQVEPSTCSSTNNSKLSIHWKDAQITHLQTNRVADIRKKAEEILNTPNFVVVAAGNTQARQVASVTGCTSKGVSPPHFVYAKKLGGARIEVHCDCPIYKSTPNICQHSVAAAEDMNILKEYLMWARKTNATSLNLSNLISKDINS